jgi:chitin-binding protein
MRSTARSLIIFGVFLTGCAADRMTQSSSTGGAGGGEEEPEEPIARDAGSKPPARDARSGGTDPGASPDAAAPAPDAAPSAATADAGGPTPGRDGGAPTPTEGPEIPGCKLVWSPSAMRDGEKAFELVEMPDRQWPGGSPGTHQGVQHISAVADHDAYRIDSHYAPPGAVDYDRVTQTGPRRDDRLRCETRGMVDSAGKQIDMLNGETWRLTWSFYLPSTLKGTSRFTHIMQMKYVDKGGGSSGSPIITQTLRSNDRMELLLWLGGGSVSIIDASGLHDKWLSADLTIKIAPSGSVRWLLKDGDKVLVDKMQNGTIWPSDGARLRPKWGIYRGITSGVVSTYIMLSELRAYHCQ